MSDRYQGGVIRAVPLAPTSSAASGIWTMEQQAKAQAAGDWPVPPPPALQISKSLRFNSADSAYLNRTPGSDGDRKTWTYSAWFKRPTNGNSTRLLSAGASGSAFTEIYFASDLLDILHYPGSTAGRLTTTQVFRDPSAWYHIVVAFDTTQATDSNRIKLYINGTQVTDLSTATYPSQNTDTYVNNTNAHYIGEYIGGGSYYADMYLANVDLVDGQALDPSYFGQFNATTGVWEPITTVGYLTYGTNGFHLDFAEQVVSSGQLYYASSLYTTKADILANATAASGGESISSQYLYFVPNSAAVNGTYIFSANGSLSATTRYFYYSGGSWTQTSGSYGTSEFTSMIFGTDSSNYQLNTSRDFYLLSSDAGQSAATGDIPTLNSNNAMPDTSGNNNNWGLNNFSFASGAGNDSLTDTPTPYGDDTGAGGEVRGNYATLNPLKNGGITLSNGNLQATSSTGWYSVASTIGMSSGKWYWEGTCTALSTNNQALLGVLNSSADISNYIGYDANGYSYYVAAGVGYKINNGSLTSYGASFTTNDVIGIALDMDAGTLTFYKNGSSQGTAFTGITGTMFAGVSCNDSNIWSMNFGQRPFAYTAPSGFKALCTTNLPEPDVVQGDTAFNTVLYTGNNGSNRAITGVGFAPDLVWLKCRNFAYNNRLVDKLQGVSSTLSSNLSTAATDASSEFISLDADGFTLTEGSGYHFNESPYTYVAWNWKADGSGSSNTDGSITSTVSANQTAGFSIVTYTGNSTSGATVGHGLGATPSMIIVRRRDGGGDDWYYYQNGLTSINYGLRLNTTAAQDLNTNTVTALSSSTFTIGTDGMVNVSGNSYVAYVFAEVDGYSKFGSYIGNNDADGPFVYTGFRPAFVLTKRIGATGNWRLTDDVRNPYNVANLSLLPNLANAESTNNIIDLLSNGFKLRESNTDRNPSAETVVYAAFAENPFKYALAR